MLEEAAELLPCERYFGSDEEFCVACIAKILMKQGEWDRSLELADSLLESGDPELTRQVGGVVDSGTRPR